MTLLDTLLLAKENPNHDPITVIKAIKLFPKGETTCL